MLEKHWMMLDERKITKDPRLNLVEPHKLDKRVRQAKKKNLLVLTENLLPDKQEDPN